MKIPLRGAVVVATLGLLAGVPGFVAEASASTLPANGTVATTEYYYQHPTAEEVVTVSAFHFGSAASVAYQIEDRNSSVVVTSGSVALSGGAGLTEVTGLSGGQYKLLYKHVDGSTATVYFRVNCDGTC